MNFAMIDDIALHYRLDGRANGMPIVFLNALGTDLRIWDAVVASLAGSYSIVRYDTRGHGLSDCSLAPYTIRDHCGDLAGLLDHLRIETAILVGISVGGMIALDFAGAWPARVEALVLCDAAPRIGTAQMWNERIQAVRHQGMAPLADAILARWFAPSFQQQHPAAYRGWRNMLTHTPVEGYTGTCAALRDADLTAHVPTIRTRTLVLCGAEDVSTPPDQARELTNGLPNAHFQLIEGAGHLPCIEQPERTGESIVQFLRENRGDKYEAGMRVRREVLGDAHVERAAADQTELDADFQRFITETAWGSVWARPGLDRQMRHLLTIVILAALGKEDELALHLRATQNTGVTPEQIKEALLHVAVYAGIPAANTAFRIAKQVYAERRIANDEET